MITAFPPMRAPEAAHGLYLSQHLADSGLDVHVLTTKGSIAPRHPRITVYPIIEDWSWRDLARFVKCARGCSPDAVLFIYVGWIYNDNLMVTFLPTISKRVLPRVPFVTQFEDPSGVLFDRMWTSLLVRVLRKGLAFWPGRCRVFYNGVFGTLLRHSDRIIVLSEHHRNILSEHFPAVNNNSVLIPSPPIIPISPENNGISRKRGRDTLGVNSDDFLIAYFGYIYPGKGAETLLRGFHLVSSQRNNVRLILIGGTIAMEFPGHTSYAKGLQELARRLGIDDRIIWTGDYAWDTDQASVYLRAADICVLPFDHGVHLNNSSFAAAAAHQLPIITTQSATSEQSFVHEENVFFCPRKSPMALATAIQTLMDRPDLRERLRAGALGMAREWFSWEKVVERTIATFSSGRARNSVC